MSVVAAQVQAAAVEPASTPTPQDVTTAVVPALKALPQLADEDLPPAAPERRDAVVPVQEKHEQVAALEGMRSERRSQACACSLPSASSEDASVKVGRVREHQVEREEGV